MTEESVRIGIRRDDLLARDTRRFHLRRTLSLPCSPLNANFNVASHDMCGCANQTLVLG